MQEKKVTLINRTNGTVGYSIPELGNLRRIFSLKERKQVPAEEVRALSYIPGGMYILKNSLILQDKELREEILPGMEPEYDYTEKEVKDLLLTGSLDELLDCLDFAPEGVLETLKAIAIKEEINDIDKRNAIKSKTGFNVTKAIEFQKAAGAETEKPVKRKRRAALPQKEEGSNQKEEILNRRRVASQSTLK